MELFPSMSYQEVMDMPYKDFKMLHQIRIKRKLKEQEDAETQRKKNEEKMKNDAAKKAFVRSK